MGITGTPITIRGNVERRDAVRTTRRDERIEYATAKQSPREEIPDERADDR